MLLNHPLKENLWDQESKLTPKLCKTITRFCLFLLRTNTNKSTEFSGPNQTVWQK